MEVRREGTTVDGRYKDTSAESAAESTADPAKELWSKKQDRRKQ